MSLNCYLYKTIYKMVYHLNFANYSVKTMIYAFVFISTCVVIHIWLFTNILNLANDVSSMFSIKNRQVTSISHNNQKHIKYILIWTKFHYYYLIKDGKVISPSLNCSNSNCVFTKDKDLFDEDYSRFDAVIFNEDILNVKDRPLKRNNDQVYIFSTLESSYNVPACEIYNDGFFNLTFTHRLDSDIVASYFVVRNRKGKIVAPSVSVKWRTRSRPILKKIKTVLAGKRKAALWLVSHCEADSLRDEYLTRLQEHLFHFGLRIDVYGKCSNKECPNDDCDEIIKKQYYFYMAFENSFAEDYVTEKVLHGYRNYAVPIVYGGANYSRFLPPNSYLNAREMHPYNLAFAMYQAIKTPDVYETYFKWTNVYTVNADYKSSHPVCKLCKILHRNQIRSTKEKFRLWWNGLNGMKWCLPTEYWNETANVNIDARHIFKLY